MKSDHYLVIWEGYPLKKDYTWEPIENLYGQEELVESYEKWLKTDNKRLDIDEREEDCQKIDSSKSPECCSGKFRKDDTLSRKASMLEGSDILDFLLSP